jgi:hypothetical protein
MCPFLHTDQTKPAAASSCLLEIEPGTVVSDRQRDVIVNARERDREPPRIGMGRRVSERLLSDAKETEGKFMREVATIAGRRDADLHIKTLLDFDTVRFQRSNQSHLLQRARMQIVRQVPHAINESGRALLQRCKRPVQSCVLERAVPVLDLADPHGQRGELLTDVVVEVPRDSSARGFLSIDESARQLTDALVAGPQLGFVGAYHLLGSPPSSALGKEPSDEHRLDGQE